MSIESIQQTRIYNSRGEPQYVGVGDKVELLPEQLPGQGEDRLHLSAKEREFMVRFLDGEGPYEVAWIGQWPCGRISIYVNTSDRKSVV